MDKGPTIYNIIKSGAAALGAALLSSLMATVQNLSKQAKFILKVIRHPKEITRAETIGFLKTLPIIGSFISIAKSTVNLIDRVKNGDKEACYRRGLSIRKNFKLHGFFSFKTNKDKCDGPGDKIEGSRCYKPCPPGKLESGTSCIGVCPPEFPATCGMLCYATQAQCDNLTENATADIIDASASIAGMAAGFGLINILGFIEKALTLVEHFAHPRCKLPDALKELK